MTFIFKQPKTSPGLLLWQLTNAWQRKQRQALSKLHLTHPQFVVLACLLWLTTNSKEEITQNQISTIASLDKMMVSDLVKTLIQKKLILRASHKTDSRAYCLNLTQKGRTLIEKALPIVEGIDIEFFSKNTVNLIQFHNILKKLLK